MQTIRKGVSDLRNKIFNNNSRESVSLGGSTTPMSDVSQSPTNFGAFSAGLPVPATSLTPSPSAAAAAAVPHSNGKTTPPAVPLSRSNSNSARATSPVTAAIIRARHMHPLTVTEREVDAIAKWGEDWRSKAITNYEMSVEARAIDALADASSRPSAVSAVDTVPANGAMLRTMGQTPLKSAMAAYKPKSIDDFVKRGGKASANSSGLAALQKSISSAPFRAPAATSASAAAAAHDTLGWATKAQKRSLPNGGTEVLAPISWLAETEDDKAFVAGSDEDEAFVQETKNKRTKTGNGTAAPRKPKGSQYIESEAGHDRAGDRLEFGEVDGSVYADEDDRQLAAAAMDDHLEKTKLLKKVNELNGELVKMYEMKETANHVAASEAKLPEPDVAKVTACAEMIVKLDLAIEKKVNEIADMSNAIKKLQSIVAKKVVTLRDDVGKPINPDLWFTNITSHFNPMKLKFEALVRSEERYRDALKAVVQKHAYDMIEVVGNQVEQKVSKKQNDFKTKKRIGRIFTYAYKYDDGTEQYVMATLCGPDRYTIDACGSPTAATAELRRPRRIYAGTYHVTHFNPLLEKPTLSSVFPPNLDPAYYPACLYFVDKLCLTQKL